MAVETYVRRSAASSGVLGLCRDEEGGEIQALDWGLTSPSRVVETPREDTKGKKEVRLGVKGSRGNLDAFHPCVLLAMVEG